MKLGQIPFNSSVLDEAIFYFAEAGNISATSSITQEIVADDSGLDFLDSAYETKITELTEAPSAPVSGSAIFIVSPYVTENNLNKEKSLAQLVHKLPPIFANFNFVDSIAQLREASLKELKAKKEAEKAAAEAGKSKKSDSKTSREQIETKIDEIEDDGWGSSSFSEKKTDLPDASANNDDW